MPELVLPGLGDVHSLVFDFDGVFTDNKVWVDQDGRESVRCDRGDGLAFDLLRTYERRGKIAVEYFVLSKETNPVVLARCKKLKIECRQSVGDKLTYLDAHFARRLPHETNPYSGLIYLGNDLNDLPIMRRAGWSVAPRDAHPRVLEVAKLVLPQRGGEGFVRAFVEIWLGIQRLTVEQIDELVSDR